MTLTEIQSRLGCTLALAHSVNELIEAHAAALTQENQGLRDEIVRLENIIAAVQQKQIQRLMDDRDAARREIERLRAALSSVGHNRQFGLCWCETEAGTYCVGQPQCQAAREALNPKNE